MAWVLVALAGCGTYASGRAAAPYYSEQQLSEMREARMRILPAVAAYDLNCDKESLQITCFAADDKQLCLSGEAAGCGQRSTYRYVSVGERSEWRLETAWSE